MEWYLPITILPGIGMLIFSTTNQMLVISTEIGGLLSKKCTEFEHQIAGLKIKQIRRLNYASALLYLAAGAYVLSGIVGASLNSFNSHSNAILLSGTVCIFVALLMLIVFSFNTIKIRQIQFKNNHNI
jgi:hypothetical protein